MIAFANVFERVFDNRVLGVLALCLLLPGCSGSGRQVTNPDNEQWFCQSNEIGDGWDCVQDENLAQVPVPTRMPPEPEPPAPLELDPLPVADGAAADIADLSADPREELARMQAEAAAGAEQPPVADGTEATAPESAGQPPGAAASPPPRSTTPTLGADTEARPMAQRPRPPPPKPEATPTAMAEESEVPKHLRLAYVPPEPTPILDLPSEYYAVQMLAMSTKELVEAYVSEHQLHGMSAARVENEGELYYVLVLGIYTTLERAQEAVTDLPPPLDMSEPWIRPLGSLQAAMRRADDLAGSARF